MEEYSHMLNSTSKPEWMPHGDGANNQGIPNMQTFGAGAEWLRLLEPIACIKVNTQQV